MSVYFVRTVVGVILAYVGVFIIVSDEKNSYIYFGLLMLFLYFMFDTEIKKIIRIRKRES